MHIVFWQPIPSFHQFGFMEVLAQESWVNSVTLKVEQELIDSFKESGWPMPEYRTVVCQIIKEGECPVDSEDHVHFFTGFNTHAKLWAVFRRFKSNRKSRVYAFTEAPPEYGISGVLRRLKYVWNGRLLSKQLSGLLALGQRGVTYYESLLSPSVPVYRFAYYDRRLCDFPRFRAQEPNDVVQFIYVGRLIPLKGLDRLLKAFSKLLDEGRKWRLLFLGDGSCEASLRRLATNLGLSSMVEWQKTVPASGVGNFYQQSDFLLQPSRADGWGMTIAESLRYGCEPIVSTSCGAVDLADSELRLPANKLQEWPNVLRKALLRGPLSREDRLRNRARAEEYSAEVGVKKVREILSVAEV